MSDSLDPSESIQYEAFVESMLAFCHCSGCRPCDGVLAGGMCDNIQDDGREETWENES